MQDKILTEQDISINMPH